MSEASTRAQPKGAANRVFSVHFKFVIAAAVTISVSLATLATILVVRERSVLRNEVARSIHLLRSQTIDHGQRFTDDLAVQVGGLLASLDGPGLEVVLATFRSRDPDIAAMFVLDNHGTVLAKHGAPVQTRLEPIALAPGSHSVFHDGTRAEFLELSEPIISGAKVRGAVHVRYDLRPLGRKADAAYQHGASVLATSTSLAVGASLFVAAFGLCFTGYISRRVLRPIDRLAEDAGLIAEGDLEHEIRAVDSKDEFGLLARKFELMRRSIQASMEELVFQRQKAEAATREEQRLRAEIERHSQSLETKVAERTAELQATNQRLQEYDRLKSEFLSNVSHELRSPLAAISSAAKIISRYGDKNKHGDKQFSSVIIQEAHRLGRLIDDLLDLAKIEAGRVQWEMDRLENPREILDHVATIFGPMFEERGIELRVVVDPQLPTVVGDRDRLIQVVTNLCSNAMKYTPPEGTVQLIASSREVDGTPSLHLAVQDNGAGIPAHELEHVFERFHQVKESINTNKPKGTGLGLAICREVVAHHNGRIWAEAADGGGTRMNLTIPATTSAPVQPTHTDPQPQAC